MRIQTAITVLQQTAARSIASSFPVDSSTGPTPPQRHLRVQTLSRKRNDDRTPTHRVHKTMTRRIVNDALVPVCIPDWGVERGR
jgi:hypothetical protein